MTCYDMIIARTFAYERLSRMNVPEQSCKHVNNGRNREIQRINYKIINNQYELYIKSKIRKIN